MKELQTEHTTSQFRLAWLLPTLSHVFQIKNRLNFIYNSSIDTFANPSKWFLRLAFLRILIILICFILQAFSLSNHNYQSHWCLDSRCQFFYLIPFFLQNFYCSRCSGRSECMVELLRGKRPDQDVAKLCHLLPEGKVVVKYLCYNASSGKKQLS